MPRKPPQKPLQNSLKNSLQNSKKSLYPETLSESLDVSPEKKELSPAMHEPAWEDHEARTPEPEAPESDSFDQDPVRKKSEEIETLELLKKSLKLLLFRLASNSDTPSVDLERILQEVITELYLEAQQALHDKRSHLRLIPGGGEHEGRNPET